MNLQDFLAMKFVINQRTAESITVKRFAMLDLVLAVKNSRKSAAIVASKTNSENAEMKISAVRKYVERP
jgi:hypothetical protein